jgi:hypothetical protein
MSFTKHKPKSYFDADPYPYNVFVRRQTDAGMTAHAFKVRLATQTKIEARAIRARIAQVHRYAHHLYARVCMYICV